MRELLLEDPDATSRLARRIAPHLRAGDVLELHGGLGAGKSHFARAVIAARLAPLGRHEDIPSPTYTLVQTYDLGGIELWHADLYRLGDPDEIAELGLSEAFETAIVLVEWASRLGPEAPPRALSLSLDFAPGDAEGRLLRIKPRGGGWDWLAGVLGGAKGAA
ncbi:MAG: tRNA (adenosine(37)-N6)-threonylcarbamoyltransferase complex ATPase subunit type 1 TsaE [Rhodobacteraceae bacterium]|nr:tRNA (adenosine(37)-N6)-threonylcarbamoyltransferase complex ATPase subunit type 1 TsaE [Paracoccaceae bacterium]